MKRRALLLINRHSRRGDSALPSIVAMLRELGFELIQDSTSKPGQVGEVVRKYKSNVALVIIVGGDGTLHAAAETLVETGLPLGIIPTGTANDLARTFGVPLDIMDACRVIAAGEPQEIDLGVVNGKHFFNVAGMGLSVKITQKLSQKMKGRWGVLAYLWTAMRAVLDARPFSATIRAGAQSYSVKTVQITVGNGRYFGGSLTVDENAAIDDGFLNLYSIEINGWWQIIPLMPAIWFGTQYNSPRVRTIAGREFEIETRRPHQVNADGELTTKTPARFTIAPRALRVVMPKS